jgi:hypothetical protein
VLPHVFPVLEETKIPTFVAYKLQVVSQGSQWNGTQIPVYWVINLNHTLYLGTLLVVYQEAKR